MFQRICLHSGMDQKQKTSHIGGLNIRKTSYSRMFNVHLKDSQSVSKVSPTSVVQPLRNRVRVTEVPTGLRRISVLQLSYLFLKHLFELLFASNQRCQVLGTYLHRLPG